MKTMSCIRDLSTGGTICAETYTKGQLVEIINPLKQYDQNVWYFLNLIESTHITWKQAMNINLKYKARLVHIGEKFEVVNAIRNTEDKIVYLLKNNRDDLVLILSEGIQEYVETIEVLGKEYPKNWVEKMLATYDKACK
jgi:hypothetical protein